jgi:phage recombination protein Bet
MSSAVAKRNQIDLTQYGFNEQALQLITDSIAREASQQELALFLTQCQRTQLDPFLKQIYCIGRYDSKLGRKVFTTQISIDGARLVAERSGKYEGQDGPYWCGEDGVWRDIWLEKTPPLAAKVGVFKHGFQKQLYAVANWSSYAQTNKDGTYSSMWAKFPSLMLAKVAEMLALRRAFPMELSGIYSIEEMQQTEVLDVEPVRLPPAKQDAVKEEREMIGAAGGGTYSVGGVRQEPAKVETPKVEEPKAAPTPIGEERFCNSAENRKLFFATCERLGVPNVEDNVNRLRKLWKFVDGCFLYELGDILQAKISEGA